MGVILSNPLLWPRLSPGCTELHGSVGLCRPPCYAWSTAAMYHTSSRDDFVSFLEKDAGMTLQCIGCHLETQLWQAVLASTWLV